MTTDVLARINARRGAAVIPYEVPEWELSCFIRPLSAAMRFNKLDKLSLVDRMVETIMVGLMDEKGARIFKDDADTKAALMAEDHVLIDRIAADIFGARFDGEAAKNS